MKRLAEAKTSPMIHLHVRSDLHLTRKAWHMSMGILMAILYQSAMSRSAAVVTLASFFGLDLLLETLRLRVPAFNEKVIRVMGPIMRSCEMNRMSGTPYYLAAALLAIAIFPKTIAILSILLLACGDPVASLVGILYGKKSISLAKGKSLIGTLAGMSVCLLVSFLYLSSLGLPDSHVVALTFLGGVAGGLAELLPLEVDDNFSIPMVSGFVLWLGFILLSV